MAADDREPLSKPGEDPYEIEWPDDAVELRAAEREKVARAAQVTPAPRALTAAVLGVGMVLLFIAIVSLIAGDIVVLLTVAWPIVLAGVALALPIGLIIDRLTRTWRPGLPEVITLAAGLAIGITWTHAGLIMLDQLTSVELAETPEQFDFMRSVAGVFMGTAVACGFMAARFWTDSLRRSSPRTVYALAAVIAVITVTSLVSFFA